MLGAYTVLARLIFKTSLGGLCCFYPHFTDESTEAQEEIRERDPGDGAGKQWGRGPVPQFPTSLLVSAPLLDGCSYIPFFLCRSSGVERLYFSAEVTEPAGGSLVPRP